MLTAPLLTPPLLTLPQMLASMLPAHVADQLKQRLYAKREHTHQPDAREFIVDARHSNRPPKATLSLWVFPKTPCSRI